MYFPAGAVFAGSSAGMYFVSLSSATTGTIFNNVYASGTPAIPAVPIAIVAAGPGAYVQTVGSDLTLINLTLTGGAIGLNGYVRSECTQSASNSAFNKYIRHKLAGNQYRQMGSTTTQTQRAWPSFSIAARSILRLSALIYFLKPVFR